MCSPRSQARDGVDVAVGVVETHGRMRPSACSRVGLIPPDVEYQGHQLMRMTSSDLKRRPQIVLVDELAPHPNARQPASKRYMDAKSWLADGIDVYAPSTSSMSRASTTSSPASPRIRVRETVPIR